MPIGNLGTFFAITFDAASQKAIVLLSLEQERPETVFASVVLVDHLVREASSLFIPDKHLLWLEASELLDTLVNIATDEVSIASMQFSISFLNQSNPHFMRICAATKDWFPRRDVNWDSFVDDYVYPIEILVNSQDEESS